MKGFIQLVLQIALIIGIAVWVYDRHPQFFKLAVVAPSKDNGSRQPALSDASPGSSQVTRDPGSDTFEKYAPPDPLPAQPNWIWMTTEGKVYKNVVISSVDADCVTILTDDGGARVELAVLSPDIQKQLNYDPLLAQRASDKRKNEEALDASLKDAEKNAIRQKDKQANQNSVVQQEQAAANFQKAQDDADRKGRIAQYNIEIADYEWQIRHLENLRKEDALHTNDPELKAD